MAMPFRRRMRLKRLIASRRTFQGGAQVGTARICKGMFVRLTRICRAAGMGGAPGCVFPGRGAKGLVEPINYPLGPTAQKTATPALAEPIN